VSRGWRLAGAVLSAVLTVYVLAVVFRSLSNVSPLPVSGPRPAAGVLLAIVAYVGCILATGVAWGWILGGLGSPSSAGQAVRILSISQFAKYLPGNVGHHVGRAVLAGLEGHRAGLVSLSIALEVGWTMAATLAVSSAALLLSGETPGLRLYGAMGSIAYVLLAAVLLLPFAMAWGLRHLPARLRGKLLGGGVATMPRGGTWLACFAVYGTIPLVIGAVMAMLETWVVGSGAGHWLYFAGVFGVAWFAGFVVPGAPAGLGVRDALMLEVLRPVIGDGPAAAITLLVRVVTTLGDVLLFCGGVAAQWWSSHRARSRTQ